MKFKYQLYRYNNLNDYFTLVMTGFQNKNKKPKLYIMGTSRIKNMYEEFENGLLWYYAPKDETSNHTLYFEFNTIEEFKNKFMEYLI